MPWQNAHTGENNWGTDSKFEVAHFQTKKTFTMEVVDVNKPADAWSLDSLVAEQRNMYQAMPSAKLRAEKPIRLEKFDGREQQYSVTGPAGTESLLVRYYLNSRHDTPRVYILTARGPRLMMEKGDAAFFFNSFIIHAQPLPGVWPGN